MNHPYRGGLSPIALATYDEGVAARLIERRRYIERARHAIVCNHLDAALRDVLVVLEQIQRSDEGVVQLHRECVAMIEQSRRVLELHEMTKGQSR